MAGQAEWFMDYRNADGSAVEMCGNGIRVFARFLVDEGWAEPGELPVATRDGVKRVRVGRDGDVTVDMGPARLPGVERTVRVGTASWPATEVDVGNPHAVVFVERLTDAGELREPPAVEPGFPQGVNVEFVATRTRFTPSRVATGSSPGSAQPSSTRNRAKTRMPLPHISTADPSALR